MGAHIIRGGLRATNMVSVGFIGLGLMGKPMCKRLLLTGNSLVVYNRSSGPATELETIGALRVSSPREVAERCEVLITMLPDSPDVKQIILGPNGVALGMKRGGTVIDCSTVSPLVEVEIAAQLRTRDVHFLDAPVTGGTMGAETGTLTFMVGGDRDCFEKCLPLFKAMGKNIFYMGGSGMGASAKLCNQIAVSLNLVGVSEALLFAYKVGLDQSKIIDVLSTGSASSWQLVNFGPKIVERDFRPGFKIKHLRKDLRIVQEVCEQRGLPTFGTSLVHEMLEAAEMHGLGDYGTPAIIVALEKFRRRNR